MLFLWRENLFFGLTIVPLPWKYSGNANYRINASKSGALVCHLSLFVVTMQDSNLHHCMKLCLFRTPFEQNEYTSFT